MLIMELTFIDETITFLNIDGIGDIDPKSVISCHIINIKVEDLIFLTNFINLIELKCSNNTLKTLDGIQYCSNLEILICDHNEIDSFEPLKDCLHLKKIDCRYNKITSFKGLENMVELNEFKTYHNPVDPTFGNPKLPLLLGNFLNYGCFDTRPAYIIIQIFNKRYVRIFNEYYAIRLFKYKKIFTLLTSNQIDEWNSYINGNEDILSEYNNDNFVKSKYYKTYKKVE